MIRPIFAGEPVQNPQQNKPQQQVHSKSFLDKFQTSVKNSADMNDTIQVPRTIFKGYFAFFASTTFLTLGGFCKKAKPIAKAFHISSALLALYGTYAFVRPYLLRQSNKKDV